MLGVSDGPRSRLPVSVAIRLGHRLAHSAAGFHRRSGCLYRGAGGTQFFHGAPSLSPHLDVLDQDFFHLLRDGRGHGHCHALSVRHQLEPLFGRHRQCPVAALRLRGPDRIFLEAAFLGVLLFGRKLVPPWAHFFAALMVSLGTLFSSFWILAANSWMQTPAGYGIIDGRFFPKDWLQVIFNPSFPFRLTHTVVAFFITTGFVVMGVGAYLMRRDRFAEEGRVMLSMTLWLLTVLVPLQIFLGDQHGLNTREHQPAKLAAIEARWETGRRVPITLFAIPDEKAEK